MGGWAAVLLLAMVGGALAAPPAPTATKRSAEDIQFGNQQNPPVSLLDDSALPGAFPSSETSEEARPPKEPAEAPEEAAPREQPAEAKDVPRREPMERDLPPVALASRWPFHGPRSVRLYRPRQYLPAWSLPLSAESFLSRRRRSAAAPPHPPAAHADPRKSQQVSSRVLEFGHRHKRDLRPLTRRPRDLASNVNLDNLLRNVDVVELLGLLSRGGGQGGPVGAGPMGAGALGAGPMGAGALGAGPRGRSHQQGFGTLSYAPVSPAAPKFSPQPRVFPEYEEDEDEDAGEEAMGPGARGQQWYPVVPAGGRVWRRSGALGLSAVPGFKRSAFRANNMQAQRARNQDDDLYSLAAMLGAELDPATHRIQRAAM
ncbi:translation initiation factor IF-2-like [Penaeus chinensis]|uniref:translation initiation factor IF-2-like n=1 Tax=Penaeus chinensis TaxID=139456 RepID=UPI001FB69070|nr:translation initiation factor IF-2-like [Penaeus chinensis]